MPLKLIKYGSRLPLAEFNALNVIRDQAEIGVKACQLNDLIVLKSGKESTTYIVLEVEGSNIYISSNPLVDLMPKK